MFAVAVQVSADALTLGLMVWASTLDPNDSGDLKTIDNIYVGCILIQVRMAEVVGGGI